MSGEKFEWVHMDKYRECVRTNRSNSSVVVPTIRDEQLSEAMRLIRLVATCERDLSPVAEKLLGAFGDLAECRRMLRRERTTPPAVEPVKLEPRF